MDVAKEEDDEEDEGDDEVKRESDAKEENESKDVEALEVRDIRYTIEKLDCLDLGYLGIVKE